MISRKSRNIEKEHDGYSVRQGYEELGIEGYYIKHSNNYSNPHIKNIEHLINQYTSMYSIGTKILDMCCGSGEVTKILTEQYENKGDSKFEIGGMDPFTYNQYETNTGNRCIRASFKDIATGALDNKQYNTIFCSYALHLCELSMLHTVLYKLSLICSKLIIITPHKRPDLHDNIYFKQECEIEYNRTKLRAYIKN